jgi:selenocysteine lyase/cysteine desulfurase
MVVNSHFPITDQITYLNTAACGLISNDVFKAKQEDTKVLYHKTPHYLDKEDDVVTETKALISEIFNADIKKIAITPNFSISFNHILDGLDQNLSFLCLKGDYPSLLYPIKKRGFKLNTLNITHIIEEEIYNYIATYAPDVLALSITQFLNGIHIKPSFLEQLKIDFPNLIILADATQYLGLEAFDFKNSRIDALLSSCYKWLNAGFGSCIVLLSDELKSKINSNTIGANSLIEKTKPNTKSMGFLEPGHYDLNSIKSLQIALKLHYKKIGIAYISKHIQNLSQLALNRFKEKQLLDEHTKKRAIHSSIFNLKIDQNKLDLFQKQQIYLSKRGLGLRVSFHYYNTQEDFEHLLRHI